MHWTTRTSICLQRTLALAAALAATATHAQVPATAEPATAGLRAAFAAAWPRQPEAKAAPARRDAAAAQRLAAGRWTPEPAALELGTTTDRLTRNRGARELEVGVAVPLWLPGERGRSAELADAELNALDSRTRAAQLRVAGVVREAWWAWQRARIDVDSAREQLDSARRLAADVAKRLKAGDLARADQHQADGAVAAAEAGLASAEAAAAAAAQQLKAITGAPVSAGAGDKAASAEPLPETTAADRAAPSEAHPTLAELRDRASVAERAAGLAAIQSRANPELTLATTRDRDAFGDRYGQTVTLGLRLPFGGGPRHDAKAAAARADAVEAQAQLELERERLSAERESARVRVESVRIQLAAAERRAQLARESRGFVDKSFRLGEADLPTRLRIEAEAAEAERQAARSRIELAAATSSLRQALGLLPE